ncbi:hypothetical protein [Sphingomonas oligophenolica]|uniref:Uncharacterized protein n=1 Tax=Sphingomonas oligophenolica TaxID=301154 RepID=A0A502CLK5_9SPHN|nr:hypothetical protein [Sphingomonas oligophenolica]TPG13632.1 hypothetical protein EAH84_05480 [Sphingomonas oligophenolica]
MPANDNDATLLGGTDPMPDPHGRAALLLVESLIHGLMERSIINIGDAIDIVDTAESVQADTADEAVGIGAPMWQSRAPLTTILESLRSDYDRGSARNSSVPAEMLGSDLADGEDER